MTTPDIKRIAEGLSKAQREALIHPRAGGISYAWATIGTLEALYARGLASRIADVGSFYSPRTAISWPLTPLGLAVRSLLVGEGE